MSNYYDFLKRHPQIKLAMAEEHNELRLAISLGLPESQVLAIAMQPSLNTMRSKRVYFSDLLTAVRSSGYEGEYSATALEAAIRHELGDVSIKMYANGMFTTVQIGEIFTNGEDLLSAMAAMYITQVSRPITR